MTWLARVMGVLTVVYSIAVLVRPRILVTPTGLVGKTEPVSVPVAALARGIGARDAFVGLAMVFAPAVGPLAVATLVRIACDLGDAVVFGTAPLDRTARLKTVAVATAWAILNALALYLLYL